MVALLVAGVVTTTWQAVRATRALGEVERQKRQVELKQQEAQAVVGFLTEHVLAGAMPERLPDAAVRDTIVRVMLDPAAAAIGKSFSQVPLVEASVRSTLANCYRALGRADLGAPHGAAALRIRQDTLGRAHADTIEAMVGLATLLREHGKYADAERTLNEALTIATDELGEAHPHVALVRENLGDLFLNQGRYAESEALLRDSLDRARRAGARPRALVDVTQNLAQAVMAQGRLEEAEALLRDSYERARRDLGERDPMTIGATSNLAQVVERSGKLHEAKALLAEGLEVARGVLGEDHVHTLILANNLASLENRLGNRAAAEKGYRELVVSMRRVLGPDHPNTLTALNNLGTLLGDQRRLDEAEPLLREALAGRRRALTDDHPLTVQSIYALTNVLGAQGRHLDAEPLLAELYRRSVTAPLDPRHAARFMSCWGVCLVELDRFEQAELPLRESHRRLTETGLTTTREMASVLHGLALVCEHSARHDEAARWRADHEALLATTRAASIRAATTRASTTRAATAGGN
jgi:tetratricopeptide (TPR) repeat protein